MITNDDIIKLHEDILQGEKVLIATQKLGISKAFYYQKIKELGLSTKREIEKKDRSKQIKSIADMHDLATLLNSDFETVHKYVNTKKSTVNNIKRMNYLKLHSPIKFQEAIITTIVNFYKLDAIKLIEKLKN